MLNGKKGVFTDEVAEHVRSRMSNAKRGNGESVAHNKPEYADVQGYDVLTILYTSPYYIYKTILMAKYQINRRHSHRVYLTEENLIECLNIQKENQRAKVCWLV